MDRKKGRVGVKTEHFGLMVSDFIKDLGEADPSDAYEAIQWAAELFKTVDVESGLSADWIFATAGYHVKISNCKTKKETVNKVIDGIKHGRVVAQAGILATIGRTWRKFAGADEKPEEWGMVLLQGEWMRETYCPAAREFLPQMARNVGLAEAELPPETPYVAIDCAYRFKRKSERQNNGS